MVLVKDIHPKDKQTVARRLADSALDSVYGKTKMWQSPRYLGATASVSGATITVTITLSNPDGLTTKVPQFAANEGVDKCPDQNKCGFPTIYIKVGFFDVLVSFFVLCLSLNVASSCVSLSHLLPSLESS